MLRLPFPTVRRTLPRIVLTLTLATAGLLALPTPAFAATTLTVSTTADIAANAGACGNSSTTPPSPLSLREATCLANNLGGAVTINIPAGTYTLANGELAPGIEPGQNVSLVGAGAGSTTINGGGNSRVLDFDSNLTGGVDATVTGLTITGGADSTFGGAGIIGGSNNNTTADSLTLNAVVITGNAANGSAPTVSNKPGGGVQFLGGRLTITNSTISNNTSRSSYGSGLAYGANGAASPEGLTITNSTFSGNVTSNTHGDTGTSDGGALALFGTPTSTFNVSGTRFINNTATSANGSGASVGAAIWQQSGALTVTGSTFTGNSVSGGTLTATGGAIEATSGTTALHYNRFTGNVAASGSAVHTVNSTVNGTDNWWGCNAGPGAAGCDTVSGTAVLAPRLVLGASALPATVTGPNGTSTITGSFVTDSAGTAVTGSNLGAFDALPATFSDPPGDATVTTSPGSHTAAFATGTGRASIDYHSGTVTGPNPVNVSFDNQTVTATVNVNQPPAITSANSAVFRTGQAGSFTITTTGYPAPAITRTGTLPTGLTFTDNGDGTATLAGTPTGSGGTYVEDLTANNGVSPNATQTLTLSVGSPPTFTSAGTATFRTGSAGSFTVTTSGNPTVDTISKTGALPTGLSFTDNGDGTATVAGTPAAGTGGTYPVTLTASNGVSPNGSQNLTVQVNQPPTVTTNPSDQTVNPGTSVSFTAAASGVPTPTVQWQRSTNGGATFANIAGATAATYTFTAAAGDDGNQYRAVFTNTAASVTTTAATLNVGSAPAFTSSNVTTFQVGSAGSFAITTSGVPSATLSRTGSAFPAWLTLTDNGDGTGSLTGTPPAGSGGTYTFTLRAANGFSPDATQTFTLSVDQSPTITSTDHATFTEGSAGSFTVTTTAGYPTATDLSHTGPLPTGVTFTDNGDGTGTLAGTPAAGSGGSYSGTFTASASGGSTPDASQAFTLTVNGPPTITSSDHTTFAVGAAGSFTVTTSAGQPAAGTLSETGALPTGVTFTDNGDGTATLAGTPAFGTGGTYPLTITADNGVAPNPTQAFTLTVNEPPTITSANHATFEVNTAGAFTITTAAGTPSATTITEAGALPNGVTFTDNGDGTATLGGTPTQSGTFPLTVTAGNGVNPDDTQSFTLTVDEPPTITSADHATFTVGTAGSFTVTTLAGRPADLTLAETGALPSGVTFTDNGDGTATLSGTPAASTGGSYPLTITADNGVAPNPTQAFTLTVDEAPSITSANDTTFVVGTAGTFTVQSTPGYPGTSALTEAGALPSGVTFTDNGDGTATLAGTPDAGTGGTYALTVTATNGADHVDQAFTLTVDESSAITSADSATFTAGTAGSFTVTTVGGFPTPPTVTSSGALPGGVTFTDNGDGTATIAGTATAGGVYPLQIVASNGATEDATQTFTLTVDGPPSITSAAEMTFTAGVAGTFTVTTRAGVPATTTLSETGDLPDGVTFTDNGDGTATIAGTPPASAIDSYPLTLTASNGVDPDATQAFTLTVARATPVDLPADQPATDGLLKGVPPRTTVGQVLHVSGAGFASGAPITIGSYSSPQVLGHATADATGHFAATVTVPNTLGSHVFVAAGLGANDASRYLEADTVIRVAPSSGSSTTSGGSTSGGTTDTTSDGTNGDGNASGNNDANNGLADTGPAVSPAQAVGWAVGLTALGLLLLMVSRRTRRTRMIGRHR